MPSSLISNGSLNFFFVQEERRRKKQEEEKRNKEDRDRKKREAEERLNKPKGPNFVITKRSDAEKVHGGVSSLPCLSCVCLCVCTCVHVCMSVCMSVFWRRHAQVSSVPHRTACLLSSRSFLCSSSTRKSSLLERPGDCLEKLDRNTI